MIDSATSTDVEVVTSCFSSIDGLQTVRTPLATVFSLHKWGSVLAAMGCQRYYDVHVLRMLGTFSVVMNRLTAGFTRLNGG